MKPLSLLQLQLLDLSPITEFNAEIKKNKQISSEIKLHVYKLCLFIKELAYTHIFDNEEKNEYLFSREKESDDPVQQVTFQFEWTMDGYVTPEEQAFEVLKIIQNINLISQNNALPHLAVALKDVSNFTTPKEFAQIITQLTQRLQQPEPLEELETHSELILDLRQYSYTRQMIKDKKLKHTSFSEAEFSEIIKFIDSKTPTHLKGHIQKKLYKNQNPPLWTVSIPYSLYSQIAPAQCALKVININYPYHDQLDTNTLLATLNLQISNALNNNQITPDDLVPFILNSSSITSSHLLSLTNSLILIYCAQHCSEEPFLELINNIPGYNVKTALDAPYWESNPQKQALLFREYVALYKSLRAYSAVLKVAELFTTEEEAANSYHELRAKNYQHLTSSRLLYTKFFLKKTNKNLNNLLGIEKVQFTELFRYADQEKNFLPDFLNKATANEVKLLFEKTPHELLVSSSDFHYLACFIALSMSTYFKQLLKKSPQMKQAVFELIKDVSDSDNESTLEHLIVQSYFTKISSSPILGRILSKTETPFKKNLENVISTLPIEIRNLICTASHFINNTRFFLLESAAINVKTCFLTFTDECFHKIRTNFGPGFLLNFLKRTNNPELLQHYFTTASDEYLRQEIPELACNSFDLLCSSVTPEQFTSLIALLSAEDLYTILNAHYEAQAPSPTYVRNQRYPTMLHYLAAYYGELFIKTINILQQNGYSEFCTNLIAINTPKIFNPLGNILGTLLVNQSPSIVNRFLGSLSGQEYLMSQLIAPSHKIFAQLYRACLSDDSVFLISHDIWNIISTPEHQNIYPVFHQFCLKNQTLSTAVKRSFLIFNAQESMTKESNPLIQRIQELMHTDRLLAKTIRAKNWSNFISSIADSTFRPPIRAPRRHLNNFRMDLLSGETKSYTPNVEHKEVHEYTKKTSATLIDRSGGTALFGEHHAHADLVGVFIDWTKCKTKATFIHDFATYYRGWVSPTVERYTDSVKEILYLENKRPDFIKQVNQNPFRHNELLVCLPYKEIQATILAIIVASDSVTARKLARAQQDALYQAFGIHWDIIFYDRFSRKMSLYDVYQQEKDEPGRQELLQTRIPVPPNPLDLFLTDSLFLNADDEEHALGRKRTYKLAFFDDVSDEDTKSPMAKTLNNNSRMAP